MSDNHQFTTVREPGEGDLFNRVEMRRRFAFLDDTWAQWREDIEGHLGIGLMALPIFLCFILLGALLASPELDSSRSIFRWGIHWSLDFLMLLLFLPIGPTLVGMTRYFMIHQRMRLRAADRAPTATQTFGGPQTVEEGKWAERPAFGLIVSGFRPQWPGLSAVVMTFVVTVIPSSIVFALGALVGMASSILALPVYFCGVLVYFALLTLHIYTFQFVAEAGLPASQAMKASREAVMADPLLAAGTLLLMAMICAFGFLLCGVGLVAAVPVAWLVLTRAYLSLPDRPLDLALNEFDPQPPKPAPPAADASDASAASVAAETPASERKWTDPEIRADDGPAATPTPATAAGDKPADPPASDAPPASATGTDPKPS